MARADYATLTIGQLKWMATNACDELEANLPGGAGESVWGMVQGFLNVSNWCVANVGQLKNTAKPIYDRLIEKGYTNTYPWTESTTDDVDNAIANIGQMKSVFDFSLTDDEDADSLEDWWEIFWFGGTNTYAGASDPDEDGLSNSGEYDAAACPTNSDTDADGYEDGYEVDHGSDPASIGSIPLADISGTIAYSSVQTGEIWVFAVAVSNDWSTNRCDVLSATGSYSVADVPHLSNHWVKAWRDSDGDQSNDYWEAWAVYDGNPLYLTGDASGIDVCLVNPPDDLDADSLPDWWEIRYFGGTNETENGDFESDGLCNLDEYVHGADPTLSDTDEDGIDDPTEVVNRTDPDNNDTNAPTAVITVPAESAELVILP